MSLINLRNGTRVFSPFPPMPSPPAISPSPPSPSPITCVIYPPKDCNGHGSLSGCSCICFSGYASSFKNLLSPIWCASIAPASSGVTNTTGNRSNPASSAAPPPSVPAPGGRSVDLTSNGQVFLYPPSSGSNVSMGNPTPVSATVFLSSAWGIVILLTGAILLAALFIYCWRKCCRCKGERSEDYETRSYRGRDRQSSRRSRRRSHSPHESEMIEVPYYQSRSLDRYQARQESKRSTIRDQRNVAHDLEAIIVEVPGQRIKQPPQALMKENPSFESL